MTLTTTEAAERLRKTPWWVRRQLVAGELRGSRYGGQWHIEESALDEYVEAHFNVTPAAKTTRRRRRRT